MRAWRLAEDARDVSPLRHALDRLALSRRARGVRRAVAERLRGGDVVRLADASELERHIDVELFAKRREGVHDFPRLEALEGSANLVCSGRERGEPIVAIG